MAPMTSHHDFRRAEITRNAVVQQGDKHIGQIVNTFHIAQAYISLQNELDLSLPRLTAHSMPSPQLDVRPS